MSCSRHHDLFCLPSLERDEIADVIYVLAVCILFLLSLHDVRSDLRFPSLHSAQNIYLFKWLHCWLRSFSYSNFLISVPLFPSSLHLLSGVVELSFPLVLIIFTSQANNERAGKKKKKKKKLHY